jgi:hypothetical protein
MLSVQLEETRGGDQDAPELGLWPALRSTALLLASLALISIGTLSLVGPSNSLSDRALRKACYSLGDHLVVARCSAHLGAPGRVDIDVMAAFVLAAILAALFFWSMHGYWRLYARGAGGLARRVFRG